MDSSGAVIKSPDARPRNCLTVVVVVVHHCSDDIEFAFADRGHVDTRSLAKYRDDQNGTAFVNAADSSVKTCLCPCAVKHDVDTVRPEYPFLRRHSVLPLAD